MMDKMTRSSVLGSACAAVLLAAPFPAAAKNVSAAPAQVAARAAPASQVLRDLFADSDAAYVQRNPNVALVRGDFSHAERFPFDISDAYYARERAANEADLRRLLAIRRSALSPAERVYYDAFESRARLAIKALEPAYLSVSEKLPLDSLVGFHIEYADLSSGSGYVTYSNVAAYDAALQRHAAYGGFVDSVIARLREGLKAGIVHPRSLVELVIAQLDHQIGPTGAGDVFLTPVRSFPETFSEVDRERLRAEYARAVSVQIVPALVRLRDFLKNDYAPHASSAAGLGAQPGGPALYALAVERNTTLKISADEVHQIGLAEIDRITAQMEQIKAQLGFEASLAELFAQMRSDPAVRVKDQDQATQLLRETEQTILSHLPKQFATLPQAALELKVIPSRGGGDDGSKTGVDAYYQAGSADRTRPGVFFFRAWTRPELETTFLHEGIPGHHLQVSLAQENTALPPFLKFGESVAYAEGWALYAESLWKEMGVESDPYSRLGGLQAEVMRAIRLVVDTGIHAKGWSREQAIAFVMAHSASSRASAESAVDRFIAEPGTVLAYKIGELEIQRLKRRAETRLGSRFDPRAFHSQILGSGPIPFEILDRKIGTWIDRAARDQGSETSSVKVKL